MPLPTASRSSFIIEQHRAASTLAIGLTDDAALLELVHDPGRARVADPQPPLEQRGRDVLVLARELDRLRDDRVGFGRPARHEVRRFAPRPPRAARRSGRA